MSDENEAHPDARRIFLEAVADVTPLAQDRVLPEDAPKPSPHPRFRIADEQAVLVDSLSMDWDPAEWDPGEVVQYAVPGLQHAVMRKLRRGQFRVAAELDLHGYTVAGARERLSGFLRWAQRDRMTCVRIIHGKGNGSAHRGPVLKRKVITWLTRRDEVLAFCSARRVDGGTGAVYVLLGRR